MRGITRGHARVLEAVRPEKRRAVKKTFTGRTFKIESESEDGGTLMMRELDDAELVRRERNARKRERRNRAGRR